jgi:uncharacterized protein (TIGR02145 family)
MKSTFILFALIIISFSSYSQTVSGINYQSVLRDGNGEILVNTEVSVLLTIRSGSPDGVSVYSEAHSLTTNAFGLINLVIGSGAVVDGIFSAIDWGGGNHFLEVAIDMNGSSDFQVIGTTQFLSVPYALHASSLTLTGEDGTPYKIKVDENGNIIAEPADDPGVVTDPDGNVYPIITIGLLDWFAINLKSTKFADGSDIPASDFKIYDHTLVDGIDSEAEMKEAYGLLYNYDAVSGSSGLCPTGWRVSDDSDWNYLESLLGASVGAGNKIKSCRQVDSPLGGDCATNDHPRWTKPFGSNYGTDDVNFAGLPSGKYEGSFSSIGSQVFFWTVADLPKTKRLWNVANNIYTTESANPAYFYSVRCVRNSSNPQVFLPSVTTAIVSNVGKTSATGGGNVTDDGGGEVTARGVVFNTIENPTLENNAGFSVDGSGLGQFVSEMTGLEIETTYFVRAYATNSAGTDYGDQVSFTTGSDETVVDVEGNVYPVVKIGNQIWMAKNLRTRTFNDGTPIPFLNNEDWAAVDYTENPAPSYGLYPHTQIEGLNSDEEVMDAYGILYNYFAATDSLGICPSGWHVPSNEEIDTLLSYISGGEAFGGKQLKSCRQVSTPQGGDCVTSDHPRWNFFSSSFFGTDDYGFGALPAGYRTSGGNYTFVGAMTGFNTSTIGLAVPPYGWVMPALRMDQANDVVFREMWQPLLGWSVRCVKDE